MPEEQQIPEVHSKAKASRNIKTAAIAAAIAAVGYGGIQVYANVQARDAVDEALIAYKRETPAIDAIGYGSVWAHIVDQSVSISDVRAVMTDGTEFNIDRVRVHDFEPSENPDVRYPKLLNIDLQGLDVGALSNDDPDFQEFFAQSKYELPFKVDVSMGHRLSPANGDLSETIRMHAPGMGTMVMDIELGSIPMQLLGNLEQQALFAAGAVQIRSIGARFDNEGIFEEMIRIDAEKQGYEDPEQYAQVMVDEFLASIANLPEGERRQQIEAAVISFIEGKDFLDVRIGSRASISVQQAFMLLQTPQRLLETLGFEISGG